MAEDALLTVRGLDIRTPAGSPLLVGVDLELKPGEIVALLGGSGAGKSTLMGALNDRARLESQGFDIKADELAVRSPIGVVPQRGALFDHLSVAGNLAVAMRNAETPKRGNTEDFQGWLQSVDLPKEWAEGGRGVSRLSGGEAQRLAVARTLAGGRKILFLDEPSVGLDPLNVHNLADLLRAEIEREGAVAIVVTHELEFAAGMADRFLYMDREKRTLVELPAPIPAGERTIDQRRQIAAAVGDQMMQRLDKEVVRRKEGGGSAIVRYAKERLQRMAAPFAVVPQLVLSLYKVFSRPRDFLEVFGVVLKQTLLRPAPFFAIVSTLIGFTLLYILHRSLGGGEMPVRPERIFSMIGSMHIIALAPPLAGILFASTSANAITAWLGGMSLTRQTEALRALGIGEDRYLWLPAWVGLAISFVAMAALFTAGMVLGGVLYLDLQVPELAGGMGPAYELVSADLFDPPPEREVFVTRAWVLVTIYAVGIAADAVAKGSREKQKAEDVTVAMVQSVMSSTFWIVGLELGSLVFIYTFL